MKKVMMLASVASMIDQFNMSNIDILKKKGYEVHVVANFEHGSTSSNQRVLEFKKELEKLDIQYYHVDFSRNLTQIGSNLKAYKQIKNLMLKNKYEFIHCHSPIGGVCGRIAAKTTQTKVMYTAHGFHFFKGAPIKSWVLYYPIEKFMSRFTDILITINKEDYHLAKSKFKAKKVAYIPGVGVNTEKFQKTMINKINKRIELGVPEDAILLFSVGELGKRKNHEVVIKALKKNKNKNIYYMICGQGELENYLIDLIKKLELEDKVFLLGFRTDIAELCKASDIYVFPSQREGLGIAALEGMSAGLPLISSYINGIKDYTENNKTGFCLEPMDVDGFAKSIDLLSTDKALRLQMGLNNLNIVKKFDIKNVEKVMGKIYENIVE